MTEEEARQLVDRIEDAVNAIHEARRCGDPGDDAWWVSELARRKAAVVDQLVRGPAQGGA